MKQHESQVALATFFLQHSIAIATDKVSLLWFFSLNRRVHTYIGCSGHPTMYEMSIGHINLYFHLEFSEEGNGS